MCISEWIGNVVMFGSCVVVGVEVVYSGQVFGRIAALSEYAKDLVFDVFASSISRVLLASLFALPSHMLSSSFLLTLLLG